MLRSEEIANDDDGRERRGGRDVSSAEGSRSTRSARSRALVSSPPAACPPQPPPLRATWPEPGGQGRAGTSVEGVGCGRDLALVDLGVLLLEAEQTARQQVAVLQHRPTFTSS